MNHLGSTVFLLKESFWSFQKSESSVAWHGSCFVACQDVLRQINTHIIAAANENEVLKDQAPPIFFMIPFFVSLHKKIRCGAREMNRWASDRWFLSGRADNQEFLPKFEDHPTILSTIFFSPFPWFHRETRTVG